MPSARMVNHSGCSLTHGWSGEHCRARSSATSMPSSRVAATNASKSSMVPRSGWIGVVPAVLGADRPRRARVAGSGAQGVVAALAEGRRRSGGSAAGRRRRSPSSATAGSRLAAVGTFRTAGAAVPASTIAPSERGKNSYHEPNSALRRSTLTSRGRTGSPARAAGARRSAASRRAAADSAGSMPVAQLARPRARARSARSPCVDAASGDTAAWPAARSAPRPTALAARSNSRAPSSHIRSTSWPRGILISASCSQVRDAGRPTPPRGSATALGGHRDLDAPAVGARRELAHRARRPRCPSGAVSDHAGGDGVVALAEHGRRDLEGLAGDGLGGPAPAVDRRGEMSVMGIRPIIAFSR